MVRKRMTPLNSSPKRIGKVKKRRSIASKFKSRLGGMTKARIGSTRRK